MPPPSPFQKMLWVINYIGFYVLYHLQNPERLSPVSAEMAAKVETGLSIADDALPRKNVFRDCKQ